MGGPARVRVSGPLAPYADGFAAELAAQGYTPLSAANLVRVLAHVSRWLVSEGLAPTEFTGASVERFLVSRRQAGYTSWLSQRGVAPLLGYLRHLDVVPEATSRAAVTPVDALLAEYRGYLVSERGLAASTVAYYERVARLFLTEQGGPTAEKLAALNTAVVTGFVLRESRRGSVGSAKFMVTALRSLLRYLHLQGLTDQPLAAAAPAVAGWRLAGLPRGLRPAEVVALLASCDRRLTTGRRDYAILLLLVRLGLRAGEVAALSLDDVDWRGGEVVIRGKGQREERLPLPVDVGEGLSGYLCGDRPPSSSSRPLFGCVRAPHHAISSGVVKAVVRHAARRAGLTGVSCHRLRHTAATEMLRAGAGLAEVGQVLRHRHAATTAIYAKVDRTALHVLARPWPRVHR
jgi:integrase/recombinase XerD